jgi:uncharacterized protein (TIRG00374 family)
MVEYIMSFKYIIIILFILLSGFGIWKLFTSPDLSIFISDLKKVLAQTNLPFLSLAVVLYFFTIPLAMLNWNAILKMFDISVPVIRLIPILMAGLFVNNITPMSKVGGEIVRVYGLYSKFRTPYAIAFLSVALSKLTDIVPITTMFIIGSFILIQSRIIKWYQFGIIVSIICFGFGIVAWCIYKKHYMQTLLSKFLGYFLRKGKRLAINQVNNYIIIWSRRQKIAFTESIMYSSALWFLTMIRLKVLAYALGFNLSLSESAVATVWYIIVGLLAFTPGGIGIIEGGLASSFVLMGFTVSQAFALTVLERAISYLLSTSIGGICLVVLGGKKFMD